MVLAIGMVALGCGDDDDPRHPDGGARDGGRVADANAADGGLADAPLPMPDASVVDAPLDNVEAGGALVARGHYLVNNLIGCVDCHTPRSASGEPDMSRLLAGSADFVKLPNGDRLPAPNLTPDVTTGLGRYTAAQIKTMFMDGIRPTPTGAVQALNPVMPYYVLHNMTAQDADAIVAYLQSLPPVSNPMPSRGAAFDVAAPSNYIVPADIPMPLAGYPQRESALRGRYLAAQSGLCIECHTPHLPSGPDAIDKSKYFQGGEDFSQFFIGTLNIRPVSANVTSDPTTGVGLWTIEQLVNVLLQGKDDEGHGICPPMPVGPQGPYGGITRQDATDIAHYLKSIPPVVNEVPDQCTWPPTVPMDAATIDSRSVDAASVDGMRMDGWTVDAVSTAVDGPSSG